MEKKTKAVFDFDNTITTKDTLFHFIEFYHGSMKFWTGMTLLLPILVLFKLKLLNSEKAKQILFSYYFKNTNFDVFQLKCGKYKEKIDDILNKVAIDKIRRHQQEGHEVLIVSASIENWIYPWAKKNGIDKIVGTQLEIVNNKLTGKFTTPNCNGNEKVKRLLTLYPNKNDYILYAYGDSKGDIPMLELADYPYYREFN